MIVAPALASAAFDPVCSGCQHVLNNVRTAPPPGRRATASSNAAELAVEPPLTSTAPSPPVAAAKLRSPIVRTCTPPPRSLAAAGCAMTARPAPNSVAAIPPRPALSTSLRSVMFPSVAEKPAPIATATASAIGVLEVHREADEIAAAERIVPRRKRDTHVVVHARL